jgi:hypothetical protein
MPTQLDHRDVVLYVNSEEIVGTLPSSSQDTVLQSLRGSGQYTFPAMSGWAGHGAISPGTHSDSGPYGAQPVYSHGLTEEESKAVQLVWRAIHDSGRTLHIVDVGKETSLRRAIQEHLHHIRRFPVLFRPDGRRLEGIEEFTLPNLEKFLTD